MGENEPSYNRVVDERIDDENGEASIGAANIRGCSCVASLCMAWRWLSNDRELSGPNAKVIGYCGLAGKP